MKRIAVLFPGIGYHKDKPLLYYSLRLAKEAGYQTECVDFSCIKWERGDLQDPIRMMELFSQAMEQAKYKIAGIDLAGTDDVLFISKSIGTVVAAGYALENGIKAKQIYFSPVVPFGEFAQPDGIAFYGDNDPLADSKEIEKICNVKGIEKHKIDGGNHSLETGDIERDLHTLVGIMNLVKLYLVRKQ